MLSDYRIEQNVMVLYYNKMNVINTSKSPVQHSNTKHINIWCQFIRELALKNIVNFNDILSKT